MKRLWAIAVMVAIAVAVFAAQWYVANGLMPPGLATIAIFISLSISYLFYEALSCRRIRDTVVRINLRRKLDFKEFLRIIGAVALLPMSSLLLSKYVFNGAVKPVRLYVLLVLLFLVGWAVGTVETSKLIESQEKKDDSCFMPLEIEQLSHHKLNNKEDKAAKI
ncbi:MAG: hypothetical protein K6T91_04925 [Firmicutes bacterium]|nr:hypothetical protein [Bacillota bacterium]